MKKIAIIQSNYIPWKGYFDLIASVDEFILYDDMQFTKNDWRNRNKIKTPKGLEWMSVPVGQDIRRRIRDVTLPDSGWQEKHWRMIEANYRRAPYFREVAQILEPIYRKHVHTHLSALNRALIEQICSYLSIDTRFSYSWDYRLEEGKTGRLVSLCKQADATEYVSGPAAQDYIDRRLFDDAGIKITWFEYGPYAAYKQQWSGPFEHATSVIDVLFNCGPSSFAYVHKDIATSSSRTS